MDTLLEGINELMQRLDGDGLLWPAVFACFIILFLLLWLLTRGLRLWYWKVNAQVNTLKNIDVKLQELEEGLKAGAASTDVVEPETDTLFNEIGNIIPEPEIIAYDGVKPERAYAYTEEELEKLIRD